MPISNPYHVESSFTRDQPANLPALPLVKPTSIVGKEAVRLHQIAQEATARLREVRDSQNEAIGRYRAAQAALQAEIVRGAQEGIDQEREHELSLELSAAERLAEPGAHQLRQRAAVARQRDSVRAYNVYLWENMPAILDAEIRPEAEAASAELVAALEKLAPVHERYRAIHEKARSIANVAAIGEHASFWAQALKLADEPAPPLPSDDGIAAFERARQVPVAVEADDAELVTVD